MGFKLPRIQILGWGLSPFFKLKFGKTGELSVTMAPLLGVGNPLGQGIMGNLHHLSLYEFF